jgi:predicted nucleic acid-binding protein
MIVDASTAISFLLKDEMSAYSVRVLAVLRYMPAVYVPSHFWLEIANGLLMAERRNRAPKMEIAEAFDMAFNLPYITDDETAKHCQGTTLSLARQHKLTIYDAVYLELALRRRVRLATFDKALCRAASAVGVDVLT